MQFLVFLFHKCLKTYLSFESLDRVEWVLTVKLMKRVYENVHKFVSGLLTCFAITITATEKHFQTFCHEDFVLLPFSAVFCMLITSQYNKHKSKITALLRKNECIDKRTVLGV